jgi:DNA repair photolyase
MIISASRRTDIPAFYADWFMKRIKEGYLFVQNPYNAHKHSRVNLSKEAVDAIVFWTKNPQPLMKHLDALSSMGYKYYFQFTLTGYPSVIEPSVPKFDKIIPIFKELSSKIGKEKVVWRFDPIIISDITSEEYILDNFKKIAHQLRNHTQRVMISFADFYKKVVKNLEKLESEAHIKFADINLNIDKINRISSHMAEIAHQNSMQIYTCSEEYDLSRYGIQHGKCIDDELLKQLFGLVLTVSKDKNQRADCGCVQSQDIGQYNSCIHDCVYCYANFNKDMAHRNKMMHDPSSPFLLVQVKGNLDKQDRKKKGEQLNLL